MRGSVVQPGIDQVPPKAAVSWARLGVRKEISSARVLTYDHREICEGITLKSLAIDLLNVLLSRGDKVDA